MLKLKLKSKHYKMMKVFFFLVVVGLFLVVQGVEAGPIDDFKAGLINGLSSIALTFAEICMSGSLFALNYVGAIASYNGFIDAPPVVLGWLMVRDVANMFFVVALLVIAFGTVLGLEQYEWKRSLIKLVLAAIFINFSKLILQLIIDASQVVTLTFYNAYKDAAGGNFINMFKLAEIQKMIASDSASNGNEIVYQVFAASVMAAIMSALAFATILAYLVILLARVVMLWILMVLSPLAFILQTIPSGKPYADEFWRKFTHHVLVAPVMFFFLWLAFATLGSGNIVAQVGINVSEAAQAGEEFAVASGLPKSPYLSLSEASTWENLSSFAMSIGFLLAGLTFVQSLGVVGGEMTQKAQRFGMAVATIASGYAAGRWVAGKTYEGGKEGIRLGGKVLGEYGRMGMAKVGEKTGIAERIQQLKMSEGRVGRALRAGDTRRKAIKILDETKEDRKRRVVEKASEAKMLESFKGTAAVGETKTVAAVKTAEEKKKTRLAEAGQKVFKEDLPEFTNNRIKQINASVGVNVTTDEKFKEDYESLQESLKAGNFDGIEKAFSSMDKKLEDIAKAKNKTYDKREIDRKAAIGTHLIRTHLEERYAEEEMGTLENRRNVLRGAFGHGYIKQEQDEETKSIEKEDNRLNRDTRARLAVTRNFEMKDKDWFTKSVKTREDEIKKAIDSLDDKQKDTLIKSFYSDKNLEHVVIGDLENKFGTDEWQKKTTDERRDLIQTETAKYDTLEKQKQKIDEHDKQKDLLRIVEQNLESEIGKEKWKGIKDEDKKILIKARVKKLTDNQKAQKIKDYHTAKQLEFDVDQLSPMIADELQTTTKNWQNMKSEEKAQKIQERVVNLQGNEKERQDLYLKKEIIEKLKKGRGWSKMSPEDRQKAVQEKLGSLDETKKEELIGQSERKKSEFISASKKSRREKIDIEAPTTISQVERLKAYDKAGVYDNLRILGGEYDTLRSQRRINKYKTELGKEVASAKDVSRAAEGKTTDHRLRWEMAQANEDFKEMEFLEWEQLRADMMERFKKIKELNQKEFDGVITDSESTERASLTQSQARLFATLMKKYNGMFPGLLAELDESYANIKIDSKENLPKVIMGALAGKTFDQVSSDEGVLEAEKQVSRDFKEKQHLFRVLSLGATAAANNGDTRYYGLFGEGVDQRGHKKMGLAYNMKAGLGESDGRLGTGTLDLTGKQRQESQEQGNYWPTYTRHSAADARAWTVKQNGRAVDYISPVALQAYRSQALAKPDEAEKKSPNSYWLEGGGTYTKSPWDQTKKEFDFGANAIREGNYLRMREQVSRFGDAKSKNAKDDVLRAFKIYLQKLGIEQVEGVDITKAEINDIVKFINNKITQKIDVNDSNVERMTYPEIQKIINTEGSLIIKELPDEDGYDDDSNTSKKGQKKKGGKGGSSGGSTIPPPTNPPTPGSSGSGSKSDSSGTNSERSKQKSEASNVNVTTPPPQSLSTQASSQTSTGEQPRSAQTNDTLAEAINKLTATLSSQQGNLEDIVQSMNQSIAEITESIKTNLVSAGKGEKEVSDKTQQVTDDFDASAGKNIYNELQKNEARLKQQINSKLDGIKDEKRKKEMESILFDQGRNLSRNDYIQIAKVVRENSSDQKSKTDEPISQS